MVYKLRESMLSASEGENSPAVETVIMEEIKMKPEDVKLRVRLVTLYQRTGRIQNGYNMCQELEAKHPWISSREWYSCVVEMCENYQVNSINEP